jgi:hypothetical protein
MIGWDKRWFYTIFEILITKYKLDKLYDDFVVEVVFNENEIFN